MSRCICLNILFFIKLLVIHNFHWFKWFRYFNLYLVLSQVASFHAISGGVFSPSDFESNDDVDIESEALKVEVCHNFVVYLDDMEFGDLFYVLRCNQPSYMCEETFTDGWGCEWEEESYCTSRERGAGIPYPNFLIF
jgi:hypothetical protein